MSSGAKANPTSDYSGQVIKLLCTQVMTDRLVRDFWERQVFGVRYLGEGQVIDFEAARQRIATK